MNTLSDEQLKELEGLLPLRICIVGDTVDEARHQMIHAFPALLSTIQALRTELAAEREKVREYQRMFQVLKENSPVAIEWLYRRTEDENLKESVHIHECDIDCSEVLEGVAFGNSLEDAVRNLAKLPLRDDPCFFVPKEQLATLTAERDALKEDVQQWKAAHEADKSVNASLRAELTASKQREQGLRDENARLRRDKTSADKLLERANDMLARAHIALDGWPQAVEWNKDYLIHTNCDDTALSTPSNQSPWRSIETAPKDGSYILIAAIDDGVVFDVLNGYFEVLEHDEQDEPWDIRDGEPWCSYEGREAGTYFCSWLPEKELDTRSLFTSEWGYTHWMPLPQPPTEEQA